jgi:hypothetical protein
MRDVPAELAARIESGAATLCLAWLLTRRDGARLGFTDHDRDLVQDGVVCRAAAGWTVGAAEGGLGFSGAGAMSAAGVLDDEGLVAADLATGLYDGASVVCRRVDWAEPALFVTLWTGRVARVRIEGEAFSAEIEGPLALLERVAGRSYGRLCDASLGDGRCGVSGDHPAFGEGCDKRFATCGGRFGNGLNFRGFPAIPGNDFLTLTPGRGERHDGSSRRG